MKTHTFAILSLALAVAALGVSPLAAQPAPAPTPAAPANLLRNGDFERSFKQEVLWDGVNSKGELQLFRQTVEALTETARLGQVGMPPSIRFEDLNGDGRKDIIAATTNGYIFTYWNQGGAAGADPTFSSPELFPVFLTIHPTANRASWRSAPRIALVDWGRRGVFDIIFGTLSGEVFFLRNAGSASAPRFDQPRTLEAIRASIATDPNRIWGNLFAPEAYDFNRDGKMDLILGEGSYSANNIHLLLAAENKTPPVFKDESRHYLAFGDGKEHLMPALVDYNGDGSMDLLVGDRAGQLSVYLNPGSGWKPGDEFKFSTLVSLGAAAPRKELIAPAVGDFNGDGKFDILLGRPNGSITVAINSGTPQQPKFDNPKPVKATDVTVNSMRPSDWEVDDKADSGVALMNFDVVKGDDANPAASGTAALKISYCRPLNKHFTFPPNNIPLASTTQKGPQTTMVNPSVPTIQRKDIPVEIGKTYDVTFKHRGKSPKTAVFSFNVSGEILAERQIVQGDRGEESRAVGQDIRESINAEGKITPSSSWAESRASLKISFKEKRLNELAKDPKKSKMRANLVFSVDPGLNGELWLDDVKIIPR